MDFDAFSVAHRPAWDRLNKLASQRRLTGDEVDELLRLYNSTATHLSTLRSTAPDPSLLQELSLILVKARSRIVGAHASSPLAIKRFFIIDLPAALYRVRWWTHAVTAVFVVVAVAFGAWVALTPEGLAAMGSAEDQKQYVEHEFAQYYAPGFDFATRVWTNNGWIALQCVAFGITGFFPAYVLIQNAIGVGTAGGLMVAHGEAVQFFSLILPHGFLELTAVFCAGATGLRLFWVLISPGQRPRSVALAQEGRSLMIVGVGLVLALLLSGVVEGFVTGSQMVWWLKLVIGALILAAFWTYVYVLGRKAARDGYTGDQAESEAGFAQIYA